MNIQRTRPPAPIHRGPLRAAMISHLSIIRDDGVPVAVAHRLNLRDPLPEVLARIALAFHETEEGVVLLRPEAAAALGLPTGHDRDRDFVDEPGELAALVAQCRAAGWNVSQIRPWTTFHRGEGPALHVGLCSYLNDKHVYPFYDTPMMMVPAMHAWWHELTGSAYRGTPGMAGTAIIRSQHQRAARKPGTREPTWHPTEPAEHLGYELPYRLDHWQAPAETLRAALGEMWPYEHGYDVVGQYLAAMVTVEVAAFNLRHSGPAGAQWDPRRAGWWLVQGSPWTDRRLPDPMGYHPLGNTEPRWLTTPTVKLLADLSAQGVYGGFTVLESWTAPGTRRVLKPFAETIRNALSVLATVEQSPTKTYFQQAAIKPLTKTLKRCYAETHGLFERKGGRIHRPDWYSAVVAEGRANLWRKLYTNGHQHGRWPLRIDVDNVWYPATEADPAAACPPAFTLLAPEEGYRLGRFRCRGSIARDVEQTEENDQ